MATSARRFRFLERGALSWPELDPLLLILTVVLPLIGVVIVASALMPVLADDTAAFGAAVLRNALITTVGIAVALGVAQVDYRRYGPRSWLLYTIAVALLIAVLVPGLASSSGPRRWLDLSLLSFQPSEIAKPALIFLLAYWAGRVGNRVRERRTFLIGLVLVGIPLVLVAVEPDLGTAVVILGTTTTVAFVAGARLRHFLLIGAVLVFGFAASVARNPYQLTRIRAFFSPGDDLLDTGYQAQQSLLALGSGGIAGKGLGMGTMKFLYLPAPHTDSVFAVIGEEFGLIGTATLVILFVILLARGLWIAHKAPDTYGRCLAAGISFQLAAQAFINMLVVNGRLPVTGLPLPFVSSGGTSLIVSLAMLGVLINVSRAASLDSER